MNGTTFDTLAAVRSLEAAGIETRHAEAIVSTVGEAATADQTELATKADLATAIADLKADMLKVAIGIVIANATLTAVFVFGAPRLLQP